MTSEAYDRFLSFFNLTQRERLDGLDASYFSPMSDTEKENAFDLLKAHCEHSTENIRGLYLCSPARAIPLFESLITQPLPEANSNRETENLVLCRAMMIGYVCNEKPTVDNLNIYSDIDIWNISESSRSTYYNLIPNNPTTNKVVQKLRDAINFEKGRLGSASAIKKLMSIYGFDFDISDNNYTNIYKLFKSSDISDQNLGFHKLSGSGEANIIG